MDESVQAPIRKAVRGFYVPGSARKRAYIRFSDGYHHLLSSSLVSACRRGLRDFLCTWSDGGAPSSNPLINCKECAFLDHRTGPCPEKAGNKTRHNQISVEMPMSQLFSETD